MKCNIQVLFDMATASYPSILQNISSYLSQSMIPLCYKKPELMPEELMQVLNHMSSRYCIVSSFPEELEEEQLYVDLHMEKSDEMGVTYLQGRFQVFVGQIEKQVIEDVFYIILNPGRQIEALNRQLFMYGQPIEGKLYPQSRKPAGLVNHPEPAPVRVMNM